MGRDLGWGTGQAARRGTGLSGAFSGPQCRDFGLKGVIPQGEALALWQDLGKTPSFGDREGEGSWLPTTTASGHLSSPPDIWCARLASWYRMKARRWKGRSQYALVTCLHATRLDALPPPPPCRITGCVPCAIRGDQALRITSVCPKASLCYMRLFQEYEDGVGDLAQW